MSERLDLTPEGAIALLPGGEMIHTCTRSMIGADWSREEIVTLLREEPCGRSGPVASRSGHGICVYQRSGYLLFVETRAEER